MKPIEMLYALFAAAHPLSELWARTNLRVFLNGVYYRSNRDDFPVSRLFGIIGSLAVLGILLAALHRDWPCAWWFALGLAVADLIQHAAHFVSRPRELAPKVHLVTIGIVVALLFGIDHDQSVRENGCLGLLVGGAGAIFLNWLQNSVRVRIRRRR